MHANRIFCRFLFFTNTDQYGDIGQYNFTSGLASEFVSSGDFPQDVVVDETEKAVYWINYVSNNYEVRKTYYNKTDILVKLYSGPTARIRLAAGERYLYVVKPTPSELDIIDKESGEVVETYSVKADTNEITAAQGTLLFRPYN